MSVKYLMFEVGLTTAAFVCLTVSLFLFLASLSYRTILSEFDLCLVKFCLWRGKLCFEIFGRISIADVTDVGLLDEFNLAVE